MEEIRDTKYSLFSEDAYSGFMKDLLELINDNIDNKNLTLFHNGLEAPIEIYHDLNGNLYAQKMKFLNPLRLTQLGEDNIDEITKEKKYLNCITQIFIKTEKGESTTTFTLYPQGKSLTTPNNEDKTYLDIITNNPNNLELIMEKFIDIMSCEEYFIHNDSSEKITKFEEFKTHLKQTKI